jgi:aldehyde dehydrogenase (NAD+)
MDSKLTSFIKLSNEFADILDSRSVDIFELLKTYETYDVVQDEIARSINTLRGLESEMKNITNPKINLNISTFFPLNLPLYSLVLFGIAPSMFSNKVYIRPPEVMHEILNKLWNLLDISTYFPNIILTPSPRHIFVQLYASESDVIIFTGKYENAIDIHVKCPDALLVYNGSGINPFIVFENADINLAVDKAIEMRCFNSGQDCAGPDAFFISTKIASQFRNKLIIKLEKIKVGSSNDKEVIVGPIKKVAYINELKNWLTDHKKDMIFGGKIDVENCLVYPSIVSRKIQLKDDEKFHEFFAPYFYLLEFDNLDSLKVILHSEHFVKRSMYVSIFGENKEIEKQLTTVKILRNVIVNDVEYGNSEYGGYGQQSNFLMYGNNKDVHPILINRDVQKVLAS